MSDRLRGHHLALTVGLVLCLMAGWARGAGFQSRQEHQAAYKAQQRLNQDQPRACMDLLQPYLDRQDRPAAVLFLLYAQAQSQTGQESGAEATYARAAELYPENELILHNYAITSLDLGHLVQAARLFERAYAQDPDPNLLYQAGAAWYRAEEYARAVRVLQPLVQRTDSAPIQWVKLAVYSLVQIERWARAEELLRPLLHKRGQEAELWRLQAHVRLQRDDVLGAASALEVAYALKPPAAEKWTELANLYAAARVPLMAVRAMQKGMGKSPAAAQCWLLGRLYAQAMRLEQAVTWMDRALAQMAKPEWILEKARTLYAHGRYAQCRETVVQTVRTGAEIQGRAWLLAGYAAWQQGDWTRAEQAFTQAEQSQETAARARSCLQAVRHILELEQRVRVAHEQPSSRLIKLKLRPEDEET